MIDRQLHHHFAGSQKGIGADINTLSQDQQRAIAQGETGSTDVSFPVGWESMLGSTLARQPLSDVRLGDSVVEANGFDSKAKRVVVVQNFLPSLQRRGGFPIQIDAEPDDNKSTNHLAVPCLTDNETALTTTLPPGLVNYYVERGLIRSAEQVISFNGNLELGSSMGFPHFDPISLAVKERCSPGSGYFVSAFTSPYIRDQARALGLTPVQQSDSYDTNDKIRFSAFGAQYGFSCCPSVALQTPSDVLEAASRFKHTPVWVKYSHAFGGDLLAKVEAPVTVDGILQAVERMSRSIHRAAGVNDYQGVALEQLWPKGALLPRCGGILVEQDARFLGNSSIPGKVLTTGSNLMLVNSDGTVEVKGYFEQIIGPAGDFWGSSALDPEQRFGVCVKEALEAQFRAIGRYCHDKLKLYGLVGVDFMVVESPDETVRVVMIELNGRPPISACSHIIGTQKLQAPFWVSRYMWAPKSLESVHDFEELVTLGDKNLARLNPSEGSVVPMYLASVTHEDERGNSRVLVKKNWGQILVAGQSKEHCAEIFDRLETARGVRFNRPNSGSW